MILYLKLDFVEANADKIYLHLLLHLSANVANCWYRLYTGLKYITLYCFLGLMLSYYASGAVYDNNAQSHE